MLSKEEKKAAALYLSNLIKGSEENSRTIIHGEVVECALSLLEPSEKEHIKKMISSSKIIKHADSENGEFIVDWCETYSSLSEKLCKLSDGNAGKFRAIISEIQNILAEKAKDYVMLPKVRKIKKIFRLSELDCHILTISYLDYIYEPFREALGNTFPRMRNAEKYVYAQAAGFSFKEVYRASYESPLIKNNILDDEFDINESVAKYFLSPKNVSFINYLCREEKGKYYDINSFQPNEEKRNLAVNLIKNVPNARILIHGPAGTGKTEFAKALCYTSNKKPFFLKDNDDVYLAAAASSDHELVIADEADSFLNEENVFSRKGSKKDNIDKNFDIMEKQCIFICNNVSEIEEPVLRRFDLIIRFKNLSKKERFNVWKENIPALLKFTNEEEIKQYSKKYKLSLGIASRSANNAFKCCDDTEKRKEAFEVMMKSHEKILGIGKMKNKKEEKKVTEFFSKDYLNMSVNPDTVEKYLKKYTESENRKELRCSFLFHGAPGTGKTEFANYIAKEAGLKSLIMKCSDIMNRYVGETEKNISKAFKKAKENGMALIFDEIDSLLYSRKDAEHTWERSSVNEFLAQMDEYKGILICTTNFCDILDSACLRRFDWKVEFYPLTPEQQFKALNNYFKGADFNISDINPFWIGKLTLGDIAVISNKCRLMDMNKEEIIERINEEVKYKSANNKIVGF